MTADRITFKQVSKASVDCKVCGELTADEVAGYKDIEELIEYTADINDLCGSNVIGYNADTVLLLRRHSENSGYANMEMLLVKNRYGSAGTATCVYDMAHNYFPRLVKRCSCQAKL